ncbi:MAG: integrase core domain-containing protein [Elusimicrobiales bacterium]|nr:integrase core domain-containing protein [Elusimicrobiales bacterium]
MLAKYLGHHGIRHIFGKPYHPQTQGKVERLNRRIKEGVFLLVYCSSGELKAAITDGIERHNATPRMRT